MATKIYSNGSASFTVVSGEKVTTFSNSPVKVWKQVGYPNHPSTWSLLYAAAAGETYLSAAMSVDTVIRVDASADDAFYETGASPSVSEPQADITASDATFTVDGLAAAQGGYVYVRGGTSSTSANAGGEAKVQGGTPGATGVGGAATVVAGAGGATSGNGGVASVTGGAGTNGNATGGAATVTGGAGQGTGNGGASSVTGGASGAGATGNGGAASIVGGAAASTAGTGGAVSVTGGAGTTTGAGGAASVTAGAGGNDAVGGAASVTGGAAGGGNRAGGAASVTGGAGAGSAAGGASSVVGGAGGATGAGGAVAVTGGAGGATSGSGGAVAITGGAGTNGNANGGSATVQGGAKNGSGLNGHPKLKGNVVVIDQGAPTAKTTDATLTIAELLTGIITGTHTAGATQTYTLPTGTLTDAGVQMSAGEAFDWCLINLSAAALDTVTVAAGVDHTVVGNMVVQSAHATTGALYGNSAKFRTRKTAANTFVTYRIA